MDNEEQIRKIEESLKRVKNLSILADKAFMTPRMKAERDLSDLYNDFVLNFLVRKKFGIGMIDNLVLETNNLKYGIASFISKMDASEFGYVKIFIKTSKFIILRITMDGVNHYKDESEKYDITVPKQRKRIVRYLTKLIQILFSFLFKSVPQFIKYLIESWMTKLILFLIALLTFILKWKEIKELFNL